MNAYRTVLSAWALTLLFLVALLALWAPVLLSDPVAWEGQPGSYTQT